MALKVINEPRFPLGRLAWVFGVMRILYVVVLVVTEILVSRVMVVEVPTAVVVEP